MATKIIHIPVFYRDILVCFGTKESLSRALARYVAGDVVEKAMREADFTGKGCTYTNQDDGVFFVWMPETPETPEDAGFLIHELFHAVTEMFRTIGVSFSEDSEEAYAYTMGYLTQQVIETFGISISCRVRQR